jgi:hypothetical protein
VSVTAERVHIACSRDSCSVRACGMTSSSWLVVHAVPSGMQAVGQERGRECELGAVVIWLLAFVCGLRYSATLYPAKPGHVCCTRHGKVG